MLDPSGLRQYSIAIALTTQLVILTVTGVWAGQALDQRFGSEPWGMLVLTSLGFAVGLAVFARGISQDDESDD